MILGAWFGEQECLHREFKECCLKVNVYDYYSEQTVDAIVSDPMCKLSYTFNEMMYDNLRRYIYEYVPKYASAFSTCNLEDSDGELVIGVSDYGEITGIPLYDTALNMDVIRMFVKDALALYTRGVNAPKGTYTDHVTVDQEELDIDMVYLCDNTTEILDVARVRQREYDNLYRRYLKERDEYLKQLSCYTCKLALVVNENREEFERYVQAHSECEVPVEIPAITFAMLEEKRDDPASYIHYLLRFKDEAVSTLLRNKPRPPLLPRCTNASLGLITHLSDLRHAFITRNPGKMRYFMIKVTFPGHTHTGGYLEYKHHLTNAWDVRRRVYEPDAIYGPCLVHL